eukprot:58217-Rhodomonas_salina.1
MRRHSHVTSQPQQTRSLLFLAWLALKRAVFSSSILVARSLTTMALGIQSFRLRRAVRGRVTQ